MMGCRGQQDDAYEGGGGKWVVLIPKGVVSA